MISATGIETSRDLDDGRNVAQHLEAKYTYMGTAEAIMVATCSAWTAEP